MSEPVRLSVVIPVHNEAENVGVLAEETNSDGSVTMIRSGF